ncbi:MULTISPECIES: glycosyl hydrolase 2 galactose-binding domain-containing protein [unclassified Amycolatopsis]|uniref:glycosyl hydrolase 2 galactose-binding domain-containing protein n=1 Tax=unclassified Amycolatopsis TaxID=2618356 RepID=UPI0028755D2E|nr:MULTISPECIES: beta-mannosidase [unclassified Amycolatopsis]MDS0138860.1 beta-mannosidase [Amycolatopsis sp. 505]MDS0147354.1 beta-mannosidase [Amycolatopsis sp. CM201R]
MTRKLAVLAALLLVPGVLSVAAPASAQQDLAQQDFARPHGLTTIGLQGWQVLTTASVKDGGDKVSTPGYATRGWLPVEPDDAGAPGTEINALVQNGKCPDVFYSDNLRKCFGYVDKLGPVVTKPFSDPWWYRTDFTPDIRPGQHAKLTIPGIVGEGDVWVNGTLVATKDVVSGAFAGHTFDVTKQVKPGRNTLAIKVYPNDPTKMYTLDQVDWGQIPPDNDTGIQFPPTLQVSDALTGDNAHVVQDNAADLSSSKLTVKLDVTNNAATAQTGDVAATVTPPSGAPIVVKQRVTIPANTKRTVAFAPVKIAHPKVWWPYSMGDQPLYTLTTAVSQDGVLSTSSKSAFGIRTVTSRLVGKSAPLPEGARQFTINGKDFVFRGGGFAPDLFLRYDKADTAHQLALIKNLGLSGVRLEGHDMPQDFYDRADRAGLLVIGGFLCCDAWQPEDASTLTERDYRIMHDSAYTIAQMERNHPSVFNYGWSDNEPVPRQESETLKAFQEADFQVPVIASAEYKSTPTLGQSGEKEGPYDWVPPTYWYDSSHFDPEDSSRTNAGGAWGFASEQSAGHTVPTLDSIKRFLSPAEQAKLWQDPEYNQYHANFEPGHGGYAFGTLYTLDQSILQRYGKWNSLKSYVDLANIANYENTRSQFEAFLHHSTDRANPATGVVYWQLNKGWPTLLWSLYNDDGDQPGAYFGAQKANKPLHAIYGYDNGSVTLDNLGATTQSGLSVRARVLDTAGKVLDDQTVSGLSLGSQGVRTGVLKPKVPAETKAPAPAQVYFVELQVTQGGKVVDRNVYWLSTQKDVVDWAKTLGNPQATLSQYSNLQALQNLPKSQVSAVASTRPSGAGLVTTVTVTNTSKTPGAAFFLRADVRRGTPDGREAPGDNQLANATWDDNDITLWPGQSQTLTVTYRAADLRGAAPVISVDGFNTGRIVVRGTGGAHA